MVNILVLLSQYELLQCTANYISSIDLLNLALASKSFNSLILGSASVFDRLKRRTLCDGRGLKQRQEFEGSYKSKQRIWIWGRNGRRRNHDEEIEVRLWNLKCDEAGALPCLKCGINVCEECRFVPRIRDSETVYTYRRPHLDPAYQLHNIVCYCPSCDAKIERKLPLRLSEYCDCDQYTRWICRPCKKREDKEDAEYFATRTKMEWEEGFPDGVYDPEYTLESRGMLLGDHQHDRAFWCPCGERPPTGGNIRCSWCKRRHDRKTWMQENPDHIPFFDNDPCYPSWKYDFFRNGPRDYPDLGYRGPIV